MKNLNQHILFENEDFIIIDKPDGIASIPDREQNDNLKEQLALVYGEIYVVHRLDRDTSGLILFAKNAESHRYFSQIFENRKVIKKYQAILDGQIFVDEGRIDRPVKTNSVGKVVISAEGKEALTEFKVIEKYRSASLVDINLLTGRTHQIRVHFQSIGFPLLVDDLYGKQSAFYLSAIKRKTFNLKKNTEERPLLSRQPLHAYHLAFESPNGEEFNFESPLPKDMRATLNQLEKWNKV